MEADKVVLCHKALRAQEFSIHEVATLIGTLASTFPGVESLVLCSIDTWNGTKNWHTSLEVFHCKHVSVC